MVERTAMDPKSETEFKRDLVTLIPHLRAFARTLCGDRHGPQTDIEQLIRDQGTIYLLAEVDEMEQARPLLTLFAQEMFLAAERVARWCRTRLLRWWGVGRDAGASAVQVCSQVAFQRSGSPPLCGRSTGSVGIHIGYTATSSPGHMPVVFSHRALTPGTPILVVRTAESGRADPETGQERRVAPGARSPVTWR